MKKILFLLLAIPNLVTANGKESNQQIDQQTAPVVTPTPPHPSIKQRLSQKAATVAKLSKDLNDLQWKKLAASPFLAAYLTGYLGFIIAYSPYFVGDSNYHKTPEAEEAKKRTPIILFLTLPTVLIVSSFTAVGATIVGAAKLGNSIVRKSVFGTKKVVDFVKKKLSTNTQN